MYNVFCRTPVVLWQVVRLFWQTAAGKALWLQRLKGDSLSFKRTQICMKKQCTSVAGRWTCPANWSQLKGAQVWVMSKMIKYLIL